MTYTDRYAFLVKFLKDNDAHTKWQHNRNVKDILEIITDEPQHAFTAAFKWWDTPEGHDYWEALYWKWMGNFK